jgi:transposase
MFEESEPSTQIAVQLRGSPKSVREWRRRWVTGGFEALASSWPGGSSCRPSKEQPGELADLLERGPVEQGWTDARWTLARVAEVIERRFGASCTLRGVACLLHRIDCSQQVPTRRAIERDPAAIAT